MTQENIINPEIKTIEQNGNLYPYTKRPYIDDYDDDDDDDDWDDDDDD